MVSGDDKHLETFYRRALKDINRAIKTTSRRDPKRNKLYEDRLTLQTKLHNITATHVDITPIDYGDW